MLKLIVAAALVFFLVGCTAYSIKSTDGYEYSETVSSDSPIAVTQVNSFPEGNHCFEPMMYFLTIGIIPTHCVDRYHVSQTEPDPQEDTELATHYTITQMQGWLALPLSLSPRWRFGLVENPESTIEAIVKEQTTVKPNNALH